MTSFKQQQKEELFTNTNYKKETMNDKFICKLEREETQRKIPGERLLHAKSTIEA